VGAFFLSCAEEEIRGEDKLVFTAFFTGACVCLGLSTCFHTFLCHSEWAGQLFSKLDYVGIALLIMGSFVPWLYYSFYCDFIPRVVYLCVEIVLGLTSIIISLWPRFGEPRYRFLRAGIDLLYLYKLNLTYTFYFTGNGDAPVDSGRVPPADTGASIRATCLTSFILVIFVRAFRLCV